MMSTNTKARSEEIQAAARALLVEYSVPLDERAPRMLLPLLMERTGCGVDAAKRHIAKAQRVARGEYAHAKWGGPRPGAGRPTEDELTARPADNTPQREDAK